MSSPASIHSPVPKAPFLGASALFLSVAILIGVFGISPLGAAELLGIAASVAAAAVFASVPYVVDFTRRLDASRAPAFVPAAHPAPAPAFDTVALTAQIAAAVESRLATALPALSAQITAELAAAEEKRRADLQASLTAATPARPIDSDSVSAPAGAKPRLGRGLLGLMHAPGALAAKPAPTAGAKPAADDNTDDDRAAA